MVVVCGPGAERLRQQHNIELTNSLIERYNAIVILMLAYK